MNLHGGFTAVGQIGIALTCSAYIIYCNNWLKNRAPVVLAEIIEIVCQISLREASRECRCIISEGTP